MSNDPKRFHGRFSPVGGTTQVRVGKALAKALTDEARRRGMTFAQVIEELAKGRTSVGLVSEKPTTERGEVMTGATVSAEHKRSGQPNKLPPPDAIGQGPPYPPPSWRE